MIKKQFQNILLFLIKAKKFNLLIKLTLILFKKQGYWVIKQLLNRGYLYTAHDLLSKLPYKKHFEYIIARVVSMQEIVSNGIVLQHTDKKPVENINVLFAVHNSLPYDHAGYAVRTHMTARQIKANAMPIAVATRPGYPWDLQKHRDRQERPVCDVVDGISYYRLFDPNKRFKRGADRDYIDVYASELERVAQQQHATIIHAHSNYLNAHAAIEAANRLGIPSVYEVRGFWHKTRLTLDPDYRNGGMFTYESTMEKAAMEAADAVVTISDAMRSLMISWGIPEEKIVLAPNTVDTSYFQPIKPDKELMQMYDLEGKTVVGFLGSITGYEGIAELIKAVETLRKEGLEIVLLIVGEGKAKQELQKSTTSSGVIFTGRVPFEEVRKYYSVFDICPFPRNDAEVCRYVPPLKVLEAMAMEKPVIVSNVPPLLEIIQDNHTGLVCKADDIKSLANAIKTLCDDTSFAQNLAYNAREWVCKHRDIKDLGKVYHEIYQTFL
jgi:glycosyltransferase involved in cell wall biosynthesis